MSDHEVMHNANERKLVCGGDHPTTKPLRIAFFVPWITKGRGGTENVGQMMANAMAARGHHADIFTFDNAKQPSRWPLNPEIRLHHLAEEDCRQNDQQLMMEVVQAAPDLIVGLHMNRTFGRYVRCARKLSIPLVLSEHIDPIFPRRIGVFGEEERQIVFSGATRIHLLVDAFKATLPACLQSKVTVIPNTIAPVGQLAEPGKSDGIKNLLTVARLMPRKNLHRLIRTFARIRREVPDWRLQIVGEGPALRGLETIARKLSISRYVEFVGHTDEPYSYFAGAHLFVLPSLYEGFPMTGIEAMAHGLPMVGYKICNGINVQIEHGRNGFLSSGGRNEGSLGEDLLTLMRDHKIREAMGLESLAKYRQLFSNEVVFNAWEEMFAQAVRGFSVEPRPTMESFLSVKLDEFIYGNINSSHREIQE